MSSKCRSLLRGSRPRLARWVTAGVLSIVVTACGTTVPLAQQVGGSTSGLATTSLQSGDGTGINPSTSQQVNADSGSSISTDNPSGNGPTGSSSGGPMPSLTTGTSGSTGRASALPPIKIGALTANGAGEYQKSLGFTGAMGDQVAMTGAVVSYLNSHGGIAGRKIQVVYYDLRPADVAADANAAYQAACTAFTQDNHVVAVAALPGAPDNFYQCLEKAGVIDVVAIQVTSSRFFQRHSSSVYMPASPTYTRLLAASVDALWSSGWLTAKSKIGVVGTDTIDGHATVDDALIPALKRHGLTLTDGMFTSTDTSQAGEYPGGALRFKTKNIDRVFFAPGGQPIYFALAAENQNYHPHYELGSLEYPYLLTQNLPASQLGGSAGLGWIPTFDVDAAHWQKTPTPGQARCKTAVKAAGQDLSNGTVLGIASTVCDDWFFLRNALKGSSTITPASVRASVESMGRSFTPAGTFGSRFAPGQLHDGADTYRLNVFNDACQCYTYVTGNKTLP